jgi:Ca2+-binding RTX toxin-like protein
MSGFASIYGGNGDDALTPTVFNQDNFIEGLGGDDVIAALGGHDTVLAGSGDDVVLAGSGKDVVFGGGGADRIFGEEGDDGLFGGSGADTLLGGSGNDVLLGGGGPDSLEGGAGDDVLGGGAGADAFGFDDGFGNDLIIGFQIGTDVLQIAANINGSGVADPSDLLTSISSDGFGNAVITLGSDTITLQGISEADLATNIGSIVQIV